MFSSCCRSVREKREVMDHYTDDHCLDHFSVESNTIIRTKDSQENGAVFLNDTEVSFSYQLNIIYIAASLYDIT